MPTIHENQQHLWNVKRKFVEVVDSRLTMADEVNHTVYGVYCSKLEQLITLDRLLELSGQDQTPSDGGREHDELMMRGDRDILQRDILIMERLMPELREP